MNYKLISSTHCKEVNEKTNPKMGIRHINYESMLQTYPLNKESKELLLFANYIKAFEGEINSNGEVEIIIN